MNMTDQSQCTPLLGIGPPENLKQLELFRWGAKHPPKDPQVSFKGKTVLVTGSNTGLGNQAAIKFAALGASKVILAVRTLSKGEAAKTKIVEITSCDPESLIVMELDMSDFGSVKAFAARLDQEVKTLDVALLNAGIAPPKYIINQSTGYESALQVNILSTAFLAKLLMPILKATAVNVTGHPSQITITGSVGHKYLKAEDLDLKEKENVLQKVDSPGFFSVERSYSVIKLLTMYIMQGLIDDYSTNAEGKLEVAVNVVCPGYCVTDLGRDFPWYIVLPTKLMQMYYGRTAEQGSRSLVSATVLGEAGHGKFWTNDVFVEPGELVTSDEGKKLQMQFWKDVCKICQNEMRA